MKKDSKVRLFEVMGRLDKTFKPKLNEEINNEFTNIRDDFGDLVKYFNQNESGKETPDDGESSTIKYVFDIPKTEFNSDMFEILKRQHSGRSHGVEGNPGGWTERGYVNDPEDLGNFYRIVVEKEYRLDV